MTKIVEILFHYILKSKMNDWIKKIKWSKGRDNTHFVQLINEHVDNFSRRNIRTTTHVLYYGAECIHNVCQVRHIFDFDRKVHREKKQTILKSKLNLTISMSIYCGHRGHVHIIACWTSKHILLHIQIKLIEKNELDIALWPRVPYPFQCSNNLNAFAGSHVVFVAIIAIDVDVNVSDAFSFCFRLRILALGSSRHW